MVGPSPENSHKEGGGKKWGVNANRYMVSFENVSELGSGNCTTL